MSNTVNGFEYVAPSIYARPSVVTINNSPVRIHDTIALFHERIDTYDQAMTHIKEFVRVHYNPDVQFMVQKNVVAHVANNAPKFPGMISLKDAFPITRLRAIYFKLPSEEFEQHKHSFTHPAAVYHLASQYKKSSPFGAKYFINPEVVHSKLPSRASIEQDLQQNLFEPSSTLSLEERQRIGRELIHLVWEEFDKRQIHVWNSFLLQNLSHSIIYNILHFALDPTLRNN